MNYLIFPRLKIKNIIQNDLSNLQVVVYNLK